MFIKTPEFEYTIPGSHTRILLTEAEALAFNGTCWAHFIEDENGRTRIEIECPVLAYLKPWVYRAVMKVQQALSLAAMNGTEFHCRGAISSKLCKIA